MAQESRVSIGKCGFDSRTRRHSPTDGRYRVYETRDGGSLPPGAATMPSPADRAATLRRSQRRGSTPRGGAPGMEKERLASLISWRSPAASASPGSADDVRNERAFIRLSACVRLAPSAPFFPVLPGPLTLHEWRNRQTPRSQKPVTPTGRAGSTPVSCTSSRHGGTAYAAG